MNINGNKIILRDIETADLTIMAELCNDSAVEGMIAGWSFPISITGQERWLATNPQSNHKRMFVIEYKKNFSGLFVLDNIDWKNRSASIGIRLLNTAPKHIGIGTDALMAIERFCFEELGFNRLDSAWLDYNKISQNLHLKCGFTIEGKKRAAIFKHGKYHDLIFAGLLKTEYFDLINRVGYWK